MTLSSFWDDPKEAQKILKEISILKGWIEPYLQLKEKRDYLKELISEAKEEKELSFWEDLQKELQVLEEGVMDLETKKMLSHELDSKSCYLAINAGAGGTEACDWVMMLSRMYERWISKKGRPRSGRF